MEANLTLHVVAGVGALALGAGVALRGVARARERAFVGLCGALALWHLGRGGFLWSDGSPGWRAAYLAGGFATPPLALAYALALSGLESSRRKPWLVTAGALALVLWSVGAWTPFGRGPFWPALAVPAAGGTLLVAVVVILQRARREPAGPGRRALLMVFAAGLLAACGGLSDFVSRDALPIPELGALTTLLFLAVVSAAIARHRLLDMDSLMFHGIVTVALAGLATGLFLLVAELAGKGEFLPYFLVSLIVVALAGPLGRWLGSGARSMLSGKDPVVRALRDVGQRLSHAGTIQEVRELFSRAGDHLPPPLALELHLTSDPDLDQLLAGEQLVTRRFLDDERAEATGNRLARIDAARERFVREGWDLALPLGGASGLLGWIAVGGPVPARYLTEELAAACAAIARQTAAILERIAALERARQQETLAAVGELAAGLAHEIRNPVAAIRGAGQALGPQATPEQHQAMLEVIAEESSRLDRVVGEFLAYARPEPAARDPVDVPRVVVEALRSARASGLVLDDELHVTSGTRPVLGDRERLRRVIDNLLRNAHEAAGDGVTVRIRIEPGPGATVCLTVEDNGPGIPEEELAHVVRPFHTTKARGTGLGLALVDRTVVAHGGELHVERAAGGGARIRIVLPAAPDA